MALASIGTDNKAVTNPPAANPKPPAPSTAPATHAPTQAAQKPATHEPVTHNPSTPKPVTHKPVVHKPTATLSQQEALGSARDYLAFQAFSKKGLIEQLSSHPARDSARLTPCGP